MPHDHSYKAKVRGNAIRWPEGIPPELEDAEEHDAEVKLSKKEKPISEEERKKLLREALEKLVQLNPFRDIADPVEWQRKQREEWDRPWDNT